MAIRLTPTAVQIGVLAFMKPDYVTMTYDKRQLCVINGWSENSPLE